MAVVEAFHAGLARNNAGARIIEVGCMGLCSLEPLVTIIKSGSFSVCYHRVTPQVVPQLIDGYVLDDDPDLDLALGTLQGGDGAAIYIPELERFEHEQRIIMSRCGYIDPEDIDHYIANGGYRALSEALLVPPEKIIEEVTRSGLRGRGGAGFSTGSKWRLCRAAAGGEKYIICNADEGDPGAFMDRVLLESDPHQMIEGMIIGAYAAGAERGFIYIRAEYPLAVKRLEIALEQARQRGFIGTRILNSSFNLDIEIIKGAGAFVSGEETAMMRAIEGKRSSPDIRPPYPAEQGLWGNPTLINNVKTLSFIPWIMNRGWEWFHSIGSEGSKGTAVFALAGKMVNNGLAEVVMGTTLKELIFDVGGGVGAGKKFKAIQIGGPSGGCLPAAMMDTKVDFDSLKQAGVIMGSGGIIAMDEDNCMVDAARFFLDFSTRESCGKCTHCRIGTAQMLLVLEDITRGKGKIEDLSFLQDMAEDIIGGALCGLGKTAPNPVVTTLRYFRDEYEAHILEKRCPALVCKDLIAYYIKPDKCERGCEHCILACPVEAITRDPKNIKIIDQSKCTKCGGCELVCPKEYNAVTRLSPPSLVPHPANISKESEL
jgi:NADH-quinone oxidoreductase subunit F